MHGVKVLRPEKIGKVIADENVKEVLLATPSALRGERRLALKVLEAFPVVVKTLPALEEIASGDVQVSDLRPIDVEDLLGRDPVMPNLELLTANVRGKVVMITGAGGSIGSELTRQLLQARAQDAGAVRSVGGRAIRYLDGARRPQAPPANGDRGGRRRPYRAWSRCWDRCSTASWWPAPFRSSGSR